jgi:hypothetical protein
MGGYEIALESKRLGPVGLGAGGSWPWLARSPSKNGRVGGAGRAGSTRDGEAFNNHGGPPSWLEGQRVLITEETPEAALAFSARLRDELDLRRTVGRAAGGRRPDDPADKGVVVASAIG